MKLLAMDELKPVKGIGYSRAHLWRLIKAGDFPRPVKIGENKNAFVETEIDTWIEGKIAERDRSREVA
jgi:prophage regulatory protein